MPQASRASVESNALTLLKLASKIPPADSDSFPALKGAAKMTFSIIEASAKITSNRQDWADFGRYVQNATAAAIQSGGAQDAPEMPSIQKCMAHVFEIHKNTDELQHSHPVGRLRLASKDRESIADMKTQVDVAIKPFSCGRRVARRADWDDSKQILARILQRYRNGVVTGHSSTSGAAVCAAHAASASESTEDRALLPVALSTAPTSSEKVFVDTALPASASQLSKDHFSKQAAVFNTSFTSGGHVTNIAGDHTVYGLEEKQLAVKMNLDRLAYADGASWDPALACLPGTRVTMLSLIDEWSRCLDGQNVLWLSGVAGSGKSAIAHTVAQALHKNRVLSSSFFLDTAVDSRNTLRSIFSTVTRDIAARHHAFAEDISTVLEEDISLASAPLARQFDELIKNPLRRHAITDPIVVVIDALDETIQDASDTELLRILRDEASELPPQFRILVTSRPTRELLLFLTGKDHIWSHIIDVSSPENAQDIEAYINRKLKDNTMYKQMGSSSPEDVTVLNLKMLAEGLFIWILTVFRYLDSADNPEGKLSALFSNAATPGRLDPTKKMDALYAAILEICGDWEDPDFCEGYVLFMGTIMAAKRPLSLAALCALHGDNQKLSPKRLPHRFGSVLEFITDHANNTQQTRKFYVSEKTHRQRLAALCIQTMVREFKIASILGTGYLAREMLDPPGIPEIVGVSDQLLYSCEYWIVHLVDIEDPDPAIMEVLTAFLPQYDTTWIEIVSSRSAFIGSRAAWQWLEVHAAHLNGFHNNESRATLLLTLAYRLSSVRRHEEAVTAIREAVDMRRALAAEKSPAANPPLADALHFIAMYLSFAGRHEEAVKGAREEVEMRRALVAEKPAAFNNSSLADSLLAVSIYWSAVSRHEEAVAAIQEAVDIRRALATEPPAAFNASLADSLHIIAIYLATLGRHEEAVTVIQEAVDMHRVLATDQPVASNASLVDGIVNSSIYQAATGRHEEAVMATREANKMCRALAAEQKAMFNSALARCLTTMAMNVAALGRQEEAVKATEEAVDLRRALAGDQPALFSRYLANSLYNMAWHLAAMGQYDEAVTKIREVVDMRRALAADQPAAFNSTLADSLYHMAVYLGALGRPNEALPASLEALVMRRLLAVEQPAVFNPLLAFSLVDLPTYLVGLGRHEEAVTAIREAVDLRRALAAEHPARFNVHLSHSLDTMGWYLAAVGRQEEAVVVTGEAVDMRRALALAQPELFNPHLANSLYNMAWYLAAVGRHEQAVTAVREAMNIRGTLAADQPATYNSPLADSLMNLSTYLAALGRHEEAVASVQKVVDILRALAAEQPTTFKATLADSLTNLSTHLAALGRHEEAVTAGREAVDLRRALAGDQPALFNRHLANSLYNMAWYLAAMDRHEQAVTAVREAIEIRRTLAADQSTPFNATLADSLLNLSTYLAALGRHEEAVTAGREAVNMRRAFAADQQNTGNAPLADSLFGMANYLAVLGRHEEAVDLRRALAADQPALFNASLADFIFNMSIHLNAVGRCEEALVASREEVDMRRTLVANQPAALQTDLADSLENMTIYLTAVGLHDGALLVTQEEADIRRAAVTEPLVVI